MQLETLYSSNIKTTDPYIKGIEATCLTGIFLDIVISVIWRREYPLIYNQSWAVSLYFI